LIPKMRFFLRHIFPKVLCICPQFFIFLHIPTCQQVCHLDSFRQVTARIPLPPPAGAPSPRGKVF
jgi:hypothetical protein